MITLTVKRSRIGPVLGRHPWVFSQALAKIPDGIPPGEPVRLVSEAGEFLASGYFNSYSQIAVRIWGYEKDEAVDTSFFRRRIECAWRIRKEYIESPSTNAYRMVNGENDLLPGLIVDKYADYLVAQFHTRGIESWKNEIVNALETVVRPEGIYERSDMPARKQENLGSSRGILSGAVPERIIIRENGCQFFVDVKHGQKTGFFLDQRDKREACMKYAKEKNVLNCFSYTGGFTVYALAGGARHVTSVDTSESALELAQENVVLNGFDPGRCEFLCGDVKRFLRNSKERSDVIILDPPAFIKDHRKKKEGIVGYRGINEMAIRLLPEEGVLITCSCSAHLTIEDFRYLLSEAGGKAGRSLRFLEAYTHGIDHPQLVPFTEGSYLKCFIVCANSKTS
ncbi:MAG TPA: class I SAM-dependent rRNA methyltransferase [Syntrophorhabdaceae bacterium]|nr:class I SAM-dependent rRNA methyltransferase [Syntrophorhabdaceae bacterium]HQM80285.1 class I SAM-dependent rRNA methyltransferase [Syntrophorhabdaceae bacterium]